MKPLELSDLHLCRAAEGWLELGNHLEAHEELEKVSAKGRMHSAVLELRFQIYAKAEKWDMCKEIARELTLRHPKQAGYWIDLAYAARRACSGCVRDAWDILLPAASAFPKEPILAFNLACYACQLGDHNGALHWLEKAFEVGNTTKLKEMALEELDLKELWEDIGKKK